MIKLSKHIVFLLLFLISCTEEDLDLRGTSPTIQFSFFNNAAGIKPDSLIAVGADSTHIFLDSVRTYRIPLNGNEEQANFTFYVDSLVSEVTVNYTTSVVYDINMIRTDAFFNHAEASNLDSIALVYDNIVLCSAKSSNSENVVLNCADTLNLETNETILLLYF